MCDKTFSEDPFMLKYCLDRYKAQGMCDKAVDNFLPTLKFVLDWFVTCKLCNALFADNDILFFDEDSGNITFSSHGMDVLSADLNNINFDDANFHEDDPKINYSCYTFGLV